MLLRVLRFVISVFSLVVVTMAQLNLPSNTFWSGQRPVQYLAVGGLILIAAAEVFMTVVDRLQLPVVRKFDQELRAALSAGISQLAHKAAADWRDIGVSAYHLRGLPWERRLVLVDTLRLGTGPEFTTRWRQGQGVIGTAYVKRHSVAVDWESYFKSAESAGPSAWQAKPAAERFGLSWGELMRTKGISGVVAAPIWSREAELIGVVCVEAPADLSAQGIGSTMLDIAHSVGDLGTPPSSWWNYVGRRVA